MMLYLIYYIVQQPTDPIFPILYAVIVISIMDYSVIVWLQIPNAASMI